MINNKLNISIFIIWLFTISGIIGILSDYSDWFLQLTPLNLSIYLLLILWNLKSFEKKLFFAFSIPFLVGYFSEFLGVNYGLIFGNYEYGENLGIKIYDVPLVICINWCVLTISSADISSFISKNSPLRALFAALMMTSLDFLIEVSAPRFDFWEFEGNNVPIQNYIGWFVVSFLIQLAVLKFEIKSDKKLSLHIFLAMTIFFTTFLIF